MTLASFVDNVRKSIFKKLSGDMSNIFIGTTIVGYIASATGQLQGIQKNEKLDSSKKKFLKFQEIADCVINIFAYFTITKGCTKFTKHLATSGKVLSEDITKKLKTCKIDLDKTKNIGNEITTRLTKLKNTKEIIKKNKIKIPANDLESINKNITNLKVLNDKYVPFSEGMGMIGTITGGLVSTNFIAPVLRNKYASTKQKQEKPLITYNYPQSTASNSMKI